MTDTHNTLSPLTRLVLFMVCLAFAGSFVATVHYLVVDLPAQQNIPKAPANSGSCNQLTERGMACFQECNVKHPEWDFIGREVCRNWCNDYVRSNC